MTNEILLRAGTFIGTLMIIAFWELILPRRRLIVSRLIRWYSNLGIVVVSTVLIRLLFPVLAVGMAEISEQKHWGLLNNLNIPHIPSILLSVFFLDMIIYLQHLMFHAVPRLWRIHRMHHTDLDFDVTTALRFHPLEISLSMLIKIAVVAVLGPPAIAVLIFETILNASAMFNHGNIRIPGSIDRILRCIIITPDMHRVHHSDIKEETNSNFGFFLSWWDFLFGTYRSQPQKGHDGMTIGTGEFQDHRYSHLHWLLVQPFIDRN